MSDRSLRYLQKSDFGGIRSRSGKRKPNQLYVRDTTTQWLDLPRGPHFNKLPDQLILEIFKFVLAYELLRKVSLVCKYWYNLCRDRTLWTSITWNGTQRTLGCLLQLTKYQVHELVLTNLCNFSGKALACLLKKCMHLKCLKLPKRACRELFERELPRTNILVENQEAGYRFSIRDQKNLSPHVHRNENYKVDKSDRTFMNYLWHDGLMSHDDDEHNRRRIHLSTIGPFVFFAGIRLRTLKETDLLTPKEFLAKKKQEYRILHQADSYFLLEFKILERLELVSLESLLQRDCHRRSAKHSAKITKTPRTSCIRNVPIQGCRMNKRLQQPNKIKPRPPKGRKNHHKDVRKFGRLQKRFRLYSLE